MKLWLIWLGLLGSIIVSAAWAQNTSAPAALPHPSLIYRDLVAESHVGLGKVTDIVETNGELYLTVAIKEMLCGRMDATEVLTINQPGPDSRVRRFKIAPGDDIIFTAEQFGTNWICRDRISKDLPRAADLARLILNLWKDENKAATVMEYLKQPPDSLKHQVGSGFLQTAPLDYALQPIEACLKSKEPPVIEGVLLSLMGPTSAARFFTDDPEHEKIRLEMLQLFVALLDQEALLTEKARECLAKIFVVAANPRGKTWAAAYFLKTLDKLPPGSDESEAAVRLAITKLGELRAQEAVPRLKAIAGGKGYTSNTVHAAAAALQKILADANPTNAPGK